MRTFLIITCLLVYSRLASQDNIGYYATREYFDSTHVLLNVIETPNGYREYYNCDSMLFVRGNFSDTIKIWTPGIEWGYTLEAFRKLRTDPRYGKTVYAKEIFHDGRVLVSSFMVTMFIFRNDSLFEIEDTLSMPQEYFKLITDNVLGIGNATINTHKIDSIKLLYNDKHAYVPKLIFAKTMFGKGKTKIKLPARVNYERDEIVLEREWTEKQKRCYVIRINNWFGKEKTSYSYAFDEDLRFIYWEGCDER